jgi:hypothetical protein
MDIINSYVEPVKTKNLVYLAKPIYGGWVTFTGHLSKKYRYPIHRLTKKTEKGERDFGYECMYRNMSLQDIIALPDLLICAVDKHFWEFLQYFPKGTGIVIHDPTECKSSKDGNPLIQSSGKGSHLLRDFKVYVIRESVQRYLLETFGIQSTFLRHPFCETTVGPTMKGMPFKNVSVARLDFDKNTDISLKANALLSKDKNTHIHLFGAENRLYVYHKLRDLGIQHYWLGKFAKTMIPQYQEGVSILKDADYMIDLSVIKGDGGGTQYTFLEAIYQDCVLILHNEWIKAGSTFQSGFNCIGVSDEHELAEFLNTGLSKKGRRVILDNAKTLLKDHVDVVW